LEAPFFVEQKDTKGRKELRLMILPEPFVFRAGYHFSGLASSLWPSVQMEPHFMRPGALITASAFGFLWRGGGAGALGADALRTGGLRLTHAKLIAGLAASLL
jgi:hypothetical protein